MPCGRSTERRRKTRRWTGKCIRLAPSHGSVSVWGWLCLDRRLCTRSSLCLLGISYVYVILIFLLPRQLFRVRARTYRMDVEVEIKRATIRMVGGGARTDSPVGDRSPVVVHSCAAHRIVCILLIYSSFYWISCALALTSFGLHECWLHFCDQHCT